MFSRFTSICLLMLAVATTAFAQKPADVEKILDDTFKDFAKAGTPGYAVAVLKDGAILAAKGFGEADLANGVPITPETVFDIGSTSKQFTASAIVLLSLDGALSLDDDIRKFLPEIPDYGTKITIRHMLHHMSGLRDYTLLLSLTGKDDADVTTAADALDVLSKQKKLCFKPGAKFEYSNTGYFLLGQIVERVTKKSLAKYLTEKFFEPLGMKSTMVLDNHTKIVPHRATGYAPTKNGGFEVAMSDWEQTGDGAVQTSVKDLALWDENFYTGKVGGPKYLEIMKGVGKLENQKPIEYGFGLMTQRIGGVTVVSHGGAWAGYRAELMRVPERHVSVICLSNLASANPSKMALEVTAAVIKRKMEVKPKVAAPTSQPAVTWNPSAAEMAAIAGEYISKELGVTWILEVKGKSLVARQKDKPGDEGQALTAGGPVDHLSVGGLDVRVRKDKEGKINALMLSARSLKDLELRRVVIKAPAAPVKK